MTVQIPFETPVFIPGRLYEITGGYYKLFGFVEEIDKFLRDDQISYTDMRRGSILLAVGCDRIEFDKKQSSHPFVTTRHQPGGLFNRGDNPNTVETLSRLILKFLSNERNVFCLMVSTQPHDEEDLTLLHEDITCNFEKSFKLLPMKQSE